jgi:hypothetical protein
MRRLGRPDDGGLGPLHHSGALGGAGRDALSPAAILQKLLAGRIYKSLGSTPGLISFDLGLDHEDDCGFVGQCKVPVSGGSS